MSKLHFPQLQRAGFAGWSTTDKGANVAVSNGNLTGTLGAAAIQGIRGIRDVSLGKFYWEITGSSWATSGTNTMIGISKSTSPIDYPGRDANGWAYYGVDGRIYNNDVPGSTYSTYSHSNTIGVAFDGPAGKLYVRKDATWQNSGDPAAGTGAVATGILSGPYYPHTGPGTGVSGPVWIINAGQMAYANAVPAGFVGLC